MNSLAATKIAWIQGLPEAWGERRIKHLYRRMKRRPSDSEGVVTAFRDGQVTLRENRRSDGFTFSVKEIGYQGVRIGDLVIHSMDGFAGAIGVSDSNGKCSPVYVVLVPANEVDADPRYHAYALRRMAEAGYISSLAKGIRERSTSFGWKEIGSELLPDPPFRTQSSIADFLDHKTAAIDKLIEKKERMIELLAEKRAALIHRAVTKGLNPDVPMKDLGVPWIGEIPAHWEIKRLKFLAKFITSGPRGWSQYYSETGPLFLRITNVSRNSIDLDLKDRQSVDPPRGSEGSRTETLPGDLLITITADIGSVGLVPDGLGEAFVSQHLALARLAKQRAVPRFVAYAAKSPWGIRHFSESMQGGTKLGLTLGDVGEMPLGIPSAVGEQQEIVEYADWISHKYGRGERSLRHQIDKLREYRQALITAAVTGQFNIPEAAA